MLSRLVLVLGAVASQTLPICDWADSNYVHDTERAFVCYVGAFLTERIPIYEPASTTISFVHTRLLPYLGGEVVIGSLLAHDSIDPCCRENTYNDLMLLRSNLTRETISIYEGLEPCHVDLTARIIAGLTTTRDRLILLADKNFPKDPERAAQELLRGLLRDRTYDLASCPKKETERTSTSRDGAYAFMWGAISACSFPLGAMVALIYIPSPHKVGMLMGFGNGALLCALAVEMFGNSQHSYTTLYEQGQKLYARLGLLGAFSGAVAGCVLFIVLNRRLNANNASPKSRARTKSSGLGVASPLMRTLGMEHDLLREPLNEDGTLSGTQGILLPEFRKDSDGSNRKRPRALTPTKSDSRAALEKWSEVVEEGPVGAHSAETALSVWLGVLLDGIPESMVIGFMTKQHRISYGFVVGVFLSNFPEALSAASLMRARYSRLKILLMWGSLMAMTAILAGLTAFAIPGRICLHNIDWEFIIRETIEGLAGGAMLCMLVCVAIPESFHLASDFAGLATLLGFLATLLVIALTHEGEAGFSCF